MIDPSGVRPFKNLLSITFMHGDGLRSDFRYGP